MHASRSGRPLWPDQADVDERYWPLWRKWVAWQHGGGSAVTKAAERLAAYVRSLEGFTMIPSPAGGYDHMGAVITDAVLQAGINYRNVVWPRVERLRREHPEARTTSSFAELLHKVGAATLLGFRGAKPDRVEVLTRFLLDEQVDTVDDLKEWLARENNLARLRELPGMGPKTVDYLRILAGLDTSAIDRHLALFLRQAGVVADTYEEQKAVIEEAAGLLGVERAVLDYSIWQYMAERAAQGETQLAEPEGDEDVAHYLHSSYREAMLEHLLIGELMRKSWPTPLEVYEPQVAATGVDVVLVRDGVTRYVQLKSTKIGGSASAVNVHKNLWSRPGSCVIWTWFDPVTLELKEFLWLGGPGQPLPPIEELEKARHTKGNAEGYKAPRPALRVVPTKWFKRLSSVEELVSELFGTSVRQAD